MPLGGYSQNWIPPIQAPQKEIVEVEKLVEVEKVVEKVVEVEIEKIVEKKIVDPEVEKRFKDNLNIEIKSIESLQKEIRACNNLLDDLIFLGET